MTFSSKSSINQLIVVLNTNNSLLPRMLGKHLVFILVVSETSLTGTYTLWLSNRQVSLHLLFIETQTHVLRKFWI